jgi:ribonuclease-3
MTGRTQIQRDARRRALLALSRLLGHEFRDLSLLDRALCHASTGNEGLPNYERLEFLGDAFLNFAVADHLFRREPEVPEGQLTSVRATIVSRRPLAAVARRLGLAALLETGKGLREEERHGERILADLTEAVLGAVYLDGGIRAARAFVRHHVLEPDAAAPPYVADAVDSKTRLLHFCQHHKLGQPRYELERTTGLQHEQEFQVGVRLADGRCAQGQGRTKRAAEKQAAANLLAGLQEGRTRQQAD